jgi:ribonuclease HI
MKPTSQSEKQPRTTIPHPSVIFYNINSASANYTTLNNTEHRRHKQVISVLKNLLKQTELLCLSETKLRKEDSSSLDRYFPNHTLYYHNGDQKRAGLLTLVPNLLLKRYQIEETHLGSVSNGHAQCLKFTPLVNYLSSHSPFNLISCYLPGDNRASAILDSFSKIDPSIHSILGGDLNTVELIEDAPQENSKLLMTGSRKIAWDTAFGHLSLTEIPQPLHTHYFITTKLADCRTSRIDRIYISHSKAERMLTSPTSFCPPLSSSILDLYEKVRNNTGADLSTKTKRFNSDHLPVALNFSPQTHNKGAKIPLKDRPYRVPHWAASNTEITSEIDRHLYEIDYIEGAYRKIELFNQVVIDATKKYFKESKEKILEYQDFGSQLTASIKLAKLATSPTPDHNKIKNYLVKHPVFASLLDIPISGDPYITARLTDYISNFLEDNEPSTTSFQKIPSAPDLLELPPTTLPDTRPPNTTLFDEIKEGRFHKRQFLTSLREDATSAPKNNNSEMTSIIQKFWGEIWDERPSPEEDSLRKYLEDHNVTVPSELIPLIPDVDDIIDLIHGSSNSSPGPDGIPFSILRKYAALLAPIIREIIVSLADGILPPPDFNYGLLHLFPKNHSNVIADTRPITISNTINRIIAKLLTIAITPAAQHILHNSQKGFIPGRQGSDHIEDITKSYYSALGKKEQMYILFLDTKKAFDSIDHKFIFLTLERINMPPWFIFALMGLMNNITVFPILAGSLANDHSIRIKRGVKQGCPLSPLLFALVYDVLLRKLSFISQIQGFGFADDLAVICETIELIITTLRIIKTFSSFSGLGLNYPKTIILTSLPPSPVVKSLLILAGFANIKFGTQVKYLGLLIGMSTTTIDIFAAAKRKFEERLSRFTGYLKRISVHKRILVFNIFLLPIFYYLASFYIIPYKEVIIPVKTLTRKAILAFNGTAYAYSHLITPRRDGGHYAPLRDLWSTNMALLGQTYHYSDSHKEFFPNMLNHTNVTAPSWGSLIVEEHRHYAAFVFLEDHCPRDSHGALVCDLGTKQKKVRAYLYNTLVTQGYWQPRSSSEAKFPTSTCNRLRKNAKGNYPIPPSPQLIIANSLKLISKFSNPRVWNHQIRVRFNSLPTDARRADANQVVPPRRSFIGIGPPPFPYPCFFCGKSSDSTYHIYFECPITTQSFNKAAKTCRAPISHSPATLLLIDHNTKDPLAVALITTHNWAIWHLRAHHFSSRPQTTSNDAVDHIVNFTLSALPHLGQKDTNDLAQGAITSLAITAPDGAIYGYTDGSALSDPVTAGAGVFIKGNIPGHPGLDIRLSFGLGEGNNNLGEMYGLAACLIIFKIIKENMALPPYTPLIVFTDSLTCLCYLTAGWTSPTTKTISRVARKNYNILSKEKNTRFYWIRGHTNIGGNDCADGLAKRGANHSANQKSQFHSKLVSYNGPESIRTIVSNHKIWPSH